MTTELRLRNQSQQLYVRALSAAWRNRVQLYEPGLWLLRDPEVEEKMLRDADIAHAVGFRRHAIAGKGWQVTPEDASSPRADLAVAVTTGLLRKIERFTTARLNLARAFFSGSRFGRIHGTTEILKLGDGKARKWWVPKRIEDMDKRLFRIVPTGEGDDLCAHWEQWHLTKMDWVPMTPSDLQRTIRHVYADDQSSLGYGRALREALGWCWYAKEHVFAESIQTVERFAQGILRAKVDGARDAETGLPNEELIRAWQDVLENLRSRHVLVHDTADNVEMVSMDSSGWELLKTMREELRQMILTLVLGANLTTAANSGGSYALGEIQENSTESLIQFDRETLEETLTKDLVGCVWRENWPNLVELGIAEECPRFTITQEKRQDPVQRASVAQVLHSMGVAIAADDLYEQTGFRQPKPGEPVIEGAVPPPPTPDMFGAGVPQ